MFSDPNMAMDMMKKNLSMIIPQVLPSPSFQSFRVVWSKIYVFWRACVFVEQTLTFAWVNFFFSGFVAGVFWLLFLFIIFSQIVNVQLKLRCSISMYFSYDHFNVDFISNYWNFCHQNQISCVVGEILAFNYSYPSKSDISAVHLVFPAKIPFPLTQRFRAMLQNGIDLSTVDVSYVSSRSWYSRYSWTKH